MKHLFMLAFAVCAMVFTGCSKDDDGTVGDLAGMWADTFESSGETHAVDIYEIKGDKRECKLNCVKFSFVVSE